MSRFTPAKKKPILKKILIEKWRRSQMSCQVAVFKPYPFKVGQKITIEGGRRAGDWEVIAVTEAKVTLRCPISKKELTWNRFCYFVEDKQMEWPSH